MPYAPEKRRALTAIFIVFLFIFSEMLVLDNNNYVELEENTNSRSIVSYSVNSNVYISSGLPDDNFGSSNDNYIGIDAQENEYRSLYRFTNNLSSNNDLIISASLTLTCDVVSQTSPDKFPHYMPLE